ncbi:MAG: hypothetical protein UR68_C0001G0015 [Candidatus Roizmanbacteria bacterium GW2011_GWA2_35_19]|uniref:Uncharacterized protein n=2 Tax=Candidatus Roizmaniibacteriota TaxID=1752723 RepID=A0A0G0EGS5_9BACT|nr:MAG: hypothetical protein UR63_C0001G0015 [Candidatus Roizmanbacteria bacterium GW2011_GWC2_35_12]KKP74415.1 MAG: hypothetical protein UR68_C0001G0015 [Candidatus Roizmanbacteria bacterium GW2011_GWA2_35_19]
MKKKELLLLSIGVFLTVLAWLIADIFHAATQEKVRAKTQIPTLDKYQIKREILNVLKERN